MKIVVYDENTDMVACIYDADTNEISTYNNCDIRIYDDNIEPVMEVDDDDNVYLIHDAYLLSENYLK